MPVGTGSIKRAAGKKTAADKRVAEQVCTEHTTEKTTEAEQRKAAPRSRKKPAESQARSGQTTSFGICQIAEELPVHLL